MSSYLVITSDGNKFRYNLENEYHCTNAPAVTFFSGTNKWYQNGLLHRLDGPAIEYANGDKCWYVHDKRHRLDGPAVERADGMKIWYYEGELIYCDSQEEFERLLKLKALW